MICKSKAQLQKLKDLLQQNKITQTNFDAWTKDVDPNNLPDRLPPKPTGKQSNKPGGRPYEGLKTGKRRFPYGH